MNRTCEICGKPHSYLSGLCHDCRIKRQTAEEIFAELEKRNKSSWGGLFADIHPIPWEALKQKYLGKEVKNES